MRWTPDRAVLMQKKLHRREQGSAYFSLCRRIDSLIRSHEELWIEHVLD